eukprot:28437-Chlamydomonas_euryale.AAC.7
MRRQTDARGGARRSMRRCAGAWCAACCAHCGKRYLPEMRVTCVRLTRRAAMRPVRQAERCVQRVGFAELPHPLSL